MMMLLNFILDFVYIDILYFFYNFIKFIVEIMIYCYVSGIFENCLNIWVM